MEFTVISSGGSQRSIRRRLKSLFNHLPRRLRRTVLFVRAHGRLPRQRPPRTFNEKVNWRIIHDRRAWVTLACDKLAAKQYVREAFPGVVVPPDLWVGTDLSELIGRDLPDRWVLKPNHTAGLCVLAQGAPDAAGIDRLEEATRGWLSVGTGRSDHERTHDPEVRTFFVEPFLGSGPEPPADYKGFVFGGQAALWQTNIERLGRHRRGFFDPKGRQIKMGISIPSVDSVMAPAELEEMNRIAGALGEGLDFVRVDLYAVDGKVFFGELSPFPDSGLGIFEPSEIDRWLGDLWTLPPLDEVRQSSR